MYDIRGADGTGTSSNPVTSGSNAKAYTIRKLADGNCWMAENLALPLALDTPVEASYNDGAIFTYVPTSAAMTTTTVTPRISNDDWNGYYYYNQYAATAEKAIGVKAGVDTDGSICPKGWKLPYNYTISTTLSYGALTNVYNITVDGENINTVTGHLILEALPLSMFRDGYYHSNGSYFYGGSRGWYYSSTAGGYSLYSVYSGVFPQYSGYPDFGYSVRCVASPLAH